MTDLVIALARETSSFMSGERFIVLGEVADPPPSAVSIVLDWERGRLPGLLVSGSDAEGLMEQPGLRGLGMLCWRNSRLEVGHPSGPGTSPLPSLEEAEAEGEAGNTLGIFAPDDREPTTTADVLGALTEALPLFRYVLWPLDDV